MMHLQFHKTPNSVSSEPGAAHTAEHQAKVFASAFLIHDKQASELESAEEISAEFGVSLQAANIAFTRLADEKDRSAAALRVERMNEEVHRLFSNPVPKPKYLDEPCIGCGEKTVVLIGVKLLCECGRLTDRPQDGDN
jgi:Zn-dependent peptidase ImmA (M78 family)